MQKELPVVMDESIRNAEKLIAAANTALAQMENDTNYDDFLYIIEGNKGSNKKHSRPVLDLNEDCFSSFFDIKEKIPIADDFLRLERKSSCHETSIEEVNSKIEAYKHELSEKEQKKPSRVWPLIRGTSSRERVAPATKTASDTNLSHKSVAKARSLNVTEDLKSKLLQTQAIVDRGIQTAREINETVNVFKHKPLKTDRFDDVSLTKSKSYEKLKKSESRSTVKSIDVKKCRKCNSEITAKKGKTQRSQENVLVTKIEAKDSNTQKYKHLNLQVLPSLNIQGDLICQKIPSVDILPGKRECIPVRANTAFETYSHEQILTNRINKVFEDIKKWNRFVENIGKKTNMECSNCGLVMRMRNRYIDSEQIDELLRICDYDVFDPRIDEFVESCRMKKEEVKFTQTEEETPPEPKKQSQTIVVDRENTIDEDKFTISDLSKELTRKYREKAAELESDHLEFENILRDVFDKIDESRELFKECDYLNKITKDEKRNVSLTVTKPVLLSYTGSVEEIDDYNNAVIRPKKPQKHKMSSREIRKKLEKKELRTNCKVLSSVAPAKVKVQPKIDVQNVPKISNSESKRPPKLTITSPDKSTKEPLDGCEETGDGKISEGPASKPAELLKDVLESKQAVKSDTGFVKLAEETPKPANTESEYESDFEEESVDDEPAAVEKQTEDKSYAWPTRLSTIAEVDSDVNKNDPAEDKNEDCSVRETLPADENINKDKPVQEKTVSSCSSTSDDDTRKLLKQVNKDLEDVVSLSGKRVDAVKGMPDNITEPLKQVLDALKNQFERTELLADKLTESIKEVKNPEEVSPVCRERDIIYNLRSTRKYIGKSKMSAKSDLLDSLHTMSLEEEDALSGKSSGELVVRNERDDRQMLEDVPTAASVFNFMDKSYSEGEVTELDMMESEGSSPSVGEVINENYSNGSEQNSVIRFI